MLMISCCRGVVADAAAVALLKMLMEFDPE